MSKRIILAGVVSGALSIIASILMFDYKVHMMADLDALRKASLLDMSIQVGILALCIVGGLWLFKIKNRGIITFGQCIVFGVLIALISGVMTGGFTFYYLTELHPEVIEASKRITLEAYKKMPNEVPLKDVENQLAQITPGNMLKANIVISTFIAVLVSAITGAFIHRQHPREETLL